MTNLFRASNWVSESKDSIVSREVTTCAGMTAHTVVLAQTRVGFLTGGRKKSFLDLEEAYARATVAITRTGALCLIMGPLDMKRHAQAELLPGRLTLSPSAIAEVLQDYVANFQKVRRLHLTVVDLWQPWK